MASKDPVVVVEIPDLTVPTRAQLIIAAVQGVMAGPRGPLDPSRAAEMACAAADAVIALCNKQVADWKAKNPTKT